MKAGFIKDSSETRLGGSPSARRSVEDDEFWWDVLKYQD